MGYHLGVYCSGKGGRAQEGWSGLRGAQRGLAPPRARRMPAFPAPAPGEFETPAQAGFTPAEQCYLPRFPKKQNAALRAADQIPTQRSGWDLGRRSSGMSALRLLQKIRRECAVRAFWPPAKTSAQAGFTPAEQCYFPRFPKKQNAALRAADQIPTQRSGWDLGRRSSGMSALRLFTKKAGASDIKLAPTMERATGLEPATSTLARWRSTR